jgi:hypothetical protein
MTIHHTTDEENEALMYDVRLAVRLALEPILEHAPVDWCLHCLHGAVTQALGEVLAQQLAMALDAVTRSPRDRVQAEELAAVLAGIAQAVGREREALAQIKAQQAARTPTVH